MNPTSKSENPAEQIVLGSLPVEIMGDDSPPKSVEATVEDAVSRATRSSRAWDKAAFQAACRAARPVVESDLRAQGRAFSRDDVRLGVKTRLHAYATKYGVRLPTRAGVAGTDLEVVAGEICGAFSMPWQSFMPPQFQVAVKAAQAGSPKAKSWLSKFFGSKSAPAPVAPAPVAPAPAAPAPAQAQAAAKAPTAESPKSDTSGSSDSLGSVTPGSVTLGAWLHRLNPLYWVKSSTERDLIDKERQAWIDNAKLQKKIGKREVVLEQGQKAIDAKRAVLAAQARTAEIEAQLKSIETQLAGACKTSGEVTAVGDDDPFARGVSPSDAAPVIEKVQRARQLNAGNANALAPICAKIKSNAPLSPEETRQVLLLLARNEQLHEFRKRLVSGDTFKDSPAKNAIHRHVVLGAAKAMTPAEQQVVAKMVAMAKAGNPNAQKALGLLRAQGYAVTPPPPSTSMGSFISDTWKLATKPLTVPAKYLWKGTKWVARKTGITKGGSSPEQVRIARLKAAANRRKAALARARAADAQSEAEYRAQQAVAAAADAEAEADDAEAVAREAAMLTAEAEHLPGQTAEDAEADTSGATAPVITPLPPTPVAVKFKEDRRRVVAKRNPRAAQVLAKSDTNTPEGVKLRASMALYAKAQKRGSKERRAVEVMVAKAKKGDPQAITDVNALKAAGLAVKAEKKAGRQVTRAYAYRAVVRKSKAAKMKAEIALGDRLARGSRTRELGKLAKIERRASQGDKKCQAFVKKNVASAKAGDPKAKKVVEALKLTRAVRVATPTRRERRNLVQARKLVKRAEKGNKTALAQIRIVDAAAQHGNPNALRAKKRIQTAAALELTVRHGKIIVPGSAATAALAGKKKKAKATVARAESKIASGTASREEAMAASKAASDSGDKVKAGELAAQAAALPSAKESLQKVAPVLAAAAVGNPQAEEAVAKASKLAEAGDPRGIETMGKVAAVKAMNDVSQGKAMDPEMKVAVRDVEAAQEGDPSAREKLATMQAQAKEGVPAAVKYVVMATGAAAVGRALAASPQAQTEWRQRAGVEPADTSRQDVQVVDAEVVAPLPPITSFWGVVFASLRALTMTTKHPFQNYKEGLAALAVGTKNVPSESAGEATIPMAVPTKTVPAKKDPEAELRVHPKKETGPDAEYRVHGAKSRVGEADISSSPGFKAVVAKMREQLSEAHVRAAAGHAPSVEHLRRAREDFTSSLKRAQENDDPAAKTRVMVYRAAGLFSSKPAAKKPDTSTLGNALSKRDELVATTRSRLQALAKRASAGDKEAAAKWQRARDNYARSSAKAARGDKAAAEVAEILKATGLFVS